MSDLDGDNWIFDSLVNFLHGNIWKIPVMGFIEEKSVVFDPDSYSELSEEKEDEFKKIHKDYIALVDFMLSSFMDDLQVTPEQVEEACHQREKQSTIIPDSHITKVALEQLQAAEDFTVFRRIMTRKNIDLQLQSLELLVAKYGVLSPSLRAEGSTDTADSGEDDFLQVVIRYTGQLDELDVFSRRASITKITKPNHQLKESHPELSPLHYCSPEYSYPENFETADAKTELNLLGTNDASIVSEEHKHNFPDTGFSKFPEEWDEIDQAQVIAIANLDTSQLIQQDLADSTTGGKDLDEDAIQPAPAMGVIIPQKLQAQRSPLKSVEVAVTTPELPAIAKPVKGIKGKKAGDKEVKKSVKFDETTIAEIATGAPEQQRILQSVRQALESDTEGESTGGAMGMDMSGSEEDIEKRRAYLRAQRDKLVELKKRERERQLENAAASSRPKSARAAQMAMRSPPAPGEKSLSARRALAARLKQELLQN